MPGVGTQVSKWKFFLQNVSSPPSFHKWLMKVKVFSSPASQKWRALCPRCWAMNCLGGQTPINSVRVTIKPLQLLFIRTCALLIVAPATAIIFSAGLGLKLPMLEIEPSCVLTKNSGRSVIRLPGSYTSAPSSLFIQYSQRLISLFYIIIRISSSL